MASLILMENHNHPDLLNKIYRIKAENYQTRNIEYLSDDLDAIFKMSQFDINNRPASIGDLIQTRDGLFIILAKSFKKVRWNDVIEL